MKRGFNGERGRSTSWNKVAPWYNKVTRGGEGHYFHQHIIIPGVLRLLELNLKFKIENLKLLDLACGNGVLAKNLPKSVEYLGVDMAESLLREARFEDKNSSHKFMYGDVGKPLTIPVHFTHSTIILSLQNISSPQGAISNASRHMVNGGKLVIVLNHPMFRIPRQTAWGIDEQRKIQYRRIDKYMTPMNIPIRMNPSDPNSENTMSYHYPLSFYISALRNSGFLVENIEEWTSDKESVGRAGRMENRGRAEIPLFMAIAAIKK